MLLPEYSIVVITNAIAEESVVVGDVGTIVLTHVDKSGQPIGYELEISSITGESLTTIGVGLSDVRLARDNDRAHTRTAA